MLNYSSLRNSFRELYGAEPRLFRAPGRVNLIGEHTDYNDGFVLPVAIDRATVVAASNRADRLVHVRSSNLAQSYEFDLDRPGAVQRGIWLDYIEGMARALEAQGARLSGADLLLQSEVPEGAGLSSSAALEISVGLALLSISAGKSAVVIDRVGLALAGQQAEHTYVGTKSGIMDQYIAALGQKNHALLIDCRTLEAVLVPINTARAAIVICDTGVKHALASSEYNTRRAECERGVELLREVMPGIQALRDVTEADFAQYEDRLPEPIRRRCRHVVTENARTLDAVEALRSDDLKQMGQLMRASHESLRDDYEVSCRELDVLAESAWLIEGVTGARMTGGGFGGSTVNFVEREHLDEFQTVIAHEYQKQFSRKPAIYISEAGSGAEEIG